MASDLGAIVERLVTNEVEMVVVGGLAALIYGTGLVTEDVDVCTPLDPPNLQRIHRALSGLHPYHRQTPQRLPLDLSADWNRKWRNLNVGTDLGDVDFIGEILGLGDYAQVCERSVPVKMPYGAYRILSLDALISSKEACGREKDLATARLLRAIREGAIPQQPPLL